jgi:hypothetical protein
MTMPMPMLADFAVRLAGGLAALLWLTPWRLVPPPFFRTHCQVILGLLVLAALDVSRAGSGGTTLGVIIGAAALGYLGAVAWGLGLPRVALPLTALIVASCAGVLVAASRSAGPPTAVALYTSARLASAFLMGSTLTAMLLGHHYLTAPAMSIEPLKRFVRCMAWGLSIRGVLAAVGLGIWVAGAAHAASGPAVSPLFLGIRWGMGVLGPAAATWMAWKTVEIRSTQSATGILYIAMILVLFGELTAMVLTRDAGVAF